MFGCESTAIGHQACVTVWDVLHVLHCAPLVDKQGAGAVLDFACGDERFEVSACVTLCLVFWSAVLRRHWCVCVCAVVPHQACAGKWLEPWSMNAFVSLRWVLWPVTLACPQLLRDAMAALYHIFSICTAMHGAAPATRHH